MPTESVAIKFIVTVAGAPVVLIDDGVKVSVLSVGAVVLFATLSVVGNALATRSAVASANVFPVTSAQNADTIVHVPGSLKRGKVRTTELVTVAAGVKLAFWDTVCVPEGLSHVIWKKLTARLSVAVKFTVTGADANVVSTEVGLKGRAVMFGGVGLHPPFTVGVAPRHN